MTGSTHPAIAVALGMVTGTDKLTDLKYVYRKDIRDRDALEQNFR